MIRVAAADLGKHSAKLLLGHLNGKLVIDSARLVEHPGDPSEAFEQWYREEAIHTCDALAVTGLYAEELRAPALSGLPEDACLEAALAHRADLAGPFNLASVGARGYAAASRDARGSFQYIENDKCSSGTGETMVKTASRFGMTLEEADRLAAGAARSIAITARCSVFAKSEMTHFGNQGEPADALFHGYFDSIARYVAALVERVRVPGPIYLIGGGTRLVTLRERLSQHFGQEVEILGSARELEALGALSIAADHARSDHAQRLPLDPRELWQAKQRKIRGLEPARRHAAKVTRLPAPPVSPGAERRPAVLGLDLGSTGSKAVLTSLETGELVLDVYDRTRGNPVEAAQRLVRALLSQSELDVRAIGVTGSGREAVATLLRAVYPEVGDRIVVLNEIVAHATAAIRSDPSRGESLSVVEIGGQDAKFIQILGGHIVESDMNKACSAGTGSFLEEQATFYGVSEIEEFTRLAAEAESPPDLGQMCTVFVAETAARARAEGFSVPDVFAGFQYSVIHNYLNRVMGQRSFGARVFFQGKPASGDALAWTLAKVSGREVIVPHNPGAMGAWGVGLCVLGELRRETLDAAPTLELGRLLDAKISAKHEFRCDDKRCATLCRIERASVDVGGTNHTVFSGGACPKFEVARATRPKLAADAPSAFDEREALLRELAAPEPGQLRIGIPNVGSLAGWMPWATTLLRELGLRPRVLSSEATTLSRGEELCSAYDSCAPMKVAHGIGSEELELLFFPRLLELTDRDDRPGRTCSTEQSMPVVLERLYRTRGWPTRVVMPVISLAQGLTAPGVMVALVDAVRELGGDLDRLPAALHAAARAQAEYEEQLARIGDRTLAYGKAHNLPVVVVCGSLHVVHDRVVNAGIPGILRQNGVLALPMDCLRIPADTNPLQRIEWADARRALRVALAARERGDVYPLLVSAFGCGPASFVEQFFARLMRGYPHTALESDGHGGNAGFVTRIQSFLHGVRRYEHARAPKNGHSTLLEPLPRRPLSQDADARLVFLSVGDGLSEVAAASYRALGFDAVTAGAHTSESFALGKRDCSGKECLPYQLIWGAFRRSIEEAPTDKRTVLVQVTGQGACRNCLFSTKDELSLEHLGLTDRVSVRLFGTEDDVRNRYQLRFWAGTVVWDALHQLYTYHRVHDPEGKRLRAIDARYRSELTALLEQPEPGGLTGMSHRRQGWQLLLDLVERAACEYASFAPSDSADLRTVLLGGDIYLRIDAFGNDELVAALARRGLRTLVEPVSVMVEYLSHENSGELLGMERGVIDHKLNDTLLRSMRRAVWSRVQPHHPWLPSPEVRQMLERAEPIIDGTPIGEAPITVGSVLHAWEEKHCDGVVLVAPWGCGPSLVAESLLRPERDIPMLFIYNDGTPVDQRRLNAFAHRVQRRPSRTRPSEPEARA